MDILSTMQYYDDLVLIFFFFFFFFFKKNSMWLNYGGIIGLKRSVCILLCQTPGLRCKIDLTYRPQYSNILKTQLLY